MVNIPVQKWRIEGGKELFDSLNDAVKEQKPGTIIEQIVVVTEVPEPEDSTKAKREQEEKNGGK